MDSHDHIKCDSLFMCVWGWLVRDGNDDGDGGGGGGVGDDNEDGGGPNNKPTNSLGIQQHAKHNVYAHT